MMCEGAHCFEPVQIALRTANYTHFMSCSAICVWHELRGLLIGLSTNDHVQIMIMNKICL